MIISSKSCNPAAGGLFPTRCGGYRRSGSRIDRKWQPLRVWPNGGTPAGQSDPAYRRRPPPGAVLRAEASVAHLSVAAGCTPATGTLLCGCGRGNCGGGSRGRVMGAALAASRGVWALYWLTSADRTSKPAATFMH